jgi:threonine dehydratase
MFHYRNHGAAYGRVLVGMQVPEAEHGQVVQFLEEIGYTFYDETDNPAYKLFLS